MGPKQNESYFGRQRATELARLPFRVIFIFLFSKKLIFNGAENKLILFSWRKGGWGYLSAWPKDFLRKPYVIHRKIGRQHIILGGFLTHDFLSNNFLSFELTVGGRSIMPLFTRGSAYFKTLTAW